MIGGSAAVKIKSRKNRQHRIEFSSIQCCPFIVLVAEDWAVFRSHIEELMPLLIEFDAVLMSTPERILSTGLLTDPITSIIFQNIP